MQKKAYVQIKIDDDAIKHLIFRFFKNSIKSYIISEKIFDDLYQIFDDSNHRINALKAYRRLKQIELFKDFNIFWTEFQRLTSDSELYNQKTLLEDLKNKMSYELQKVLAIESYKIIDLHQFVKMCRYINQTLRDVNNKFKNIRDFNSDDNVDDAEREEIIVIVNSNQTNQNTDRSISRSRFEISEFELNFRAITQSSSLSGFCIKQIHQRIELDSIELDLPTFHTHIKSLYSRFSFSFLKSIFLIININ
jgi:hypothetical protein